MVTLNRAVAAAMVHGPAAGLELLTTQAARLSAELDDGLAHMGRGVPERALLEQARHRVRNGLAAGVAWRERKSRTGSCDGGGVGELIGAPR